MKGNMQLFSVEQQRSQALEAHAASFAQFKVCLFVHMFLFLNIYLNNCTLYHFTMLTILDCF